MSKTELIDTIVRHEWDDFSQVKNLGGIASCQKRPDMFRTMRRALLATWDEALLESYLDDLVNARSAGRSLMSEKYAWMMESTDAPEFDRIRSLLPLLSYETCESIAHIVKFFLVWQAVANENFPRLTSDGRPLLTEDDAQQVTSFETYLRGELKCYSARTVKRYEDYVVACWAHKRNLAIENLDHIAQAYGYENAADAELRAE